MKIAIIGGGASGVTAAIMIKKDHPDYSVCIFESNEKLLKKIYATGNGKCNFANVGELSDKYDNESFALPILNEFNADKVISFFDKIGVHSKNVDNLVYPVSESAETVALMLLKQVEQLGIEVKLNTKVDNYHHIGNKIHINGEAFDKVIFASGGKSSPQLGTDGSLFDLLKKHGYDFKQMNPSLCPIKVKENVKRLDGTRAKVAITLTQDNKPFHGESGELLFKKDGLSGIVIFNATHYINQLDNKDNIKIHINFVPDLKEIVSKDAYIEYVKPQLADYLLFHGFDIHNAVFTFSEMYDYQYSQVTSGGLCLSNLNNDLSSKNEKNIYFIGEMVDVSAVCGGYNLMWAFASAYKVAKSIK